MPSSKVTWLARGVTLLCVAFSLAEALLSIDRAGDLSLLLPRPLTVAVGDAPLADVLLGRTIELELPELGAEGPATVRAIRPCPEVETANHAGRRLITGTFHHSAGNVLKLEIEDADGPIGVTSNHPFWSADRQAFVEAGQLQVGEQLQQADGTLVQVTRITPHTGPPVEVYNLEVDAEHVYHVGVGGVLVHNAYPVVIGESMNRVKAAVQSLRAQGINAKWYQTWSRNWPKGRSLTAAEEVAAKARNIRWLASKKKLGVTIYDIGIDPSRAKRSIFYDAESTATQGYRGLVDLLGF
jgi:Pretoxin HINT domain